MKASLTFDLPEEAEDFELTVKARAMRVALDDIGSRVFRPARKHGYPEPHLQKWVNDFEQAEALIHDLEQLFYDILREHDVLE